MRIQMPRGDIRNVRFKVLNPDKKSICETDFTEIYFTVKRKASDKTMCFQKRLSTGGITKIGTGVYQIRIAAEDTNDMQINTQAFPNYDADIELVYENQIKQTINITYVLTEEVTHASDEE